MDAEQIQRAISLLNNLAATHGELHELLAALGMETESIHLLDIGQIEQILAQLNKLLGQQVALALARVNFRDDHYTFVRAIDGDTIVVAPPDQLRGWLKDIHVRLYGLEVPELWEPQGEEYRQHLEELCDVDAGRRLHIVWERERTGNQYSGFPLASFERGIGHVFFEKSKQFLYVNGMMLTLPDASVERRGKILLRNKAIGNGLPLPYTGSCHTDLGVSDVENTSLTFRAIATRRPPVCLLSFDTLPSLDPENESFSGAADGEFGRASRSCPFSRVDRHRYREDIQRQKMSPFDISLWLLHLWSNQDSRPDYSEAV